MKDLESRSFQSFGQLARHLREDIAKTRRATLADRLGFHKAYGAYIQQVEVGKVGASIRLMATYTTHFGLDPNYVMQTYMRSVSRTFRHALKSGSKAVTTRKSVAHLGG